MKIIVSIHICWILYYRIFTFNDNRIVAPSVIEYRSIVYCFNTNIRSFKFTFLFHKLYFFLSLIKVRDTIYMPFRLSFLWSPFLCNCDVIPNPPNITITRVIPPHIKEARVETIAHKSKALIIQAPPIYMNLPLNPLKIRGFCSPLYTL